MIRRFLSLFLLTLAASLAPAAPPAPPAPASPAPAATGEPLNKALITADATWLFHIDLQSIRAGGLGELLSVPDLEAGLEPADLEKLRRILPALEKLKAVTLYGKDADEDRAVILLRTSATPDEFFAAFDATELTEHPVQAGGYTLRSWIVEDEPVFGFAESDKDRADGLIIISNHPDTIVAAIDTARGKAPSLAAVAAKGGGSALADAPPPRPGTTIFLVASNLDALRKDARTSFLLERAQLLRLEFGEHKGMIFSAVALTTDTAESARHIADAARGLLAMGQLSLGQNHEYAGASAALNALAITADGSTATLAFSCNADLMKHALTALKDAKRNAAQHRSPRKPPHPDTPNKESARPADAPANAPAPPPAPR